MHTRLRPALLFRFFFKSAVRYGGGRARGLTLLVGLLVVGLTVPAHAQVGFPGASDDRSVNARVYPTAFWGPRAGIGAGGGLVVHNVARPNDQWLLTAAPARHEQVGTLSFASADPHRARRYVLVDTRVLHTDREWIGPWTLERSAVRGRVRVGQHLWGRRLLVQPHVTALFSSASTVRGRSGYGSVGPAAAVRDDAQTGLRAGLALRYDARPHSAPHRRGLRLQAVWDRYVPLDDSDLRFDQVDLEARGVLPIVSGHRLVARLGATLTANRGDAALPLYMQPTLSGTAVPGWPRAHAVGPDRLLGSLLYRFPLWGVGSATMVEGHVGGHLAGVYDDLGDQFAATVSRAKRPSGPDVPLRPSGSVGLRLSVPFRPRATVDLAVGVSPEGVSATRVSFSHRLQSVRAPHHRADPVR